MATHKQDLSKLSINQLSQITGLAYNTVKCRLSGLDPISKDGRTLYFPTPGALAKIYGVNAESERDRLNRTRADQVEFDMSIKRKQFAPITLLEHAIADFAAQGVSILESLPKRIKNSMPSLRAREVRILDKELSKFRAALTSMQIRFDIEDDASGLP